MSKKRRSFSAEFKAKVGLEALKGIEPIHVIAQRHEVHPVQVSQWKKEVAEGLPEVFAKPSAQVRDEIAQVQREKELYARIGQLQLLQPFVTFAIAAPLLGERIDGATVAFATAVAVVVALGRRAAIARRG